MIGYRACWDLVHPYEHNQRISNNSGLLLTLLPSTRRCVSLSTLDLEYLALRMNPMPCVAPVEAVMEIHRPTCTVWTLEDKSALFDRYCVTETKYYFGEM